MELWNEILIDAPPERIWRVLGERFMHVGEWAAPITSSCSVGTDVPGAGATRACTIAPFGPIGAGVVQERLTRYEPDERAFEYEAIAGMPRFVARAVNRWSVARVADAQSVVKIHASLELRGPMALFGCVLRWQFLRAGAKVAEELKHFVEHGRPHPRKSRSAALPHSGSAAQVSGP
ncbi:MAG: SRPBCC family protein [Polyangiaceae bacterium]